MTERPGDDVLVRRARAGDESAFRELYDRSVAELKARLRHEIGTALGRKVDASDVLQDAYVVALRRFHDFDETGEESFGRWLGKIVEYKLRETIRHYAGAEKRALKREITRAHRPESGELEGGVSSPSQRAMAGEMHAAVAAALARLPPDYRESIRLLQELHLSLDVAAQRLGRTRAATQKLYERALARLAEELGVDA